MTTDTYSAPRYDGYVRKTNDDCAGGALPDFVYDNWPALAWIWCSEKDDPIGSKVYRRGYIGYNVVLPPAQTVTKVELRLRQTALPSTTRDTVFFSQAVKVDSYGDAESLFNGVGAGTIYTQGLYILADQTIDLGAQACLDLMAHPTWFDVGVLIDEGLPTSFEEGIQYDSSRHVGDPPMPTPPELIVTYSPTPSGATPEYVVSFRRRRRMGR